MATGTQQDWMEWQGGVGSVVAAGYSERTLGRTAVVMIHASGTISIQITEQREGTALTPDEVAELKALGERVADQLIADLDAALERFEATDERGCQLGRACHGCDDCGAVVRQ